MPNEGFDSDRFAEFLRNCFLCKSGDCGTLKIDRRRSVYSCGDTDRSIYYIESGQIKLLLTAPSGKECLLAIHTPGEIFGELCLAGIERRRDTAIAMEDAVLKRMPCNCFLALMRSAGLMEGLARYLAGRLADQQQIIAELVTVDSEHRLGSTLLRLAAKLGKHDPRSMRIEQRISHQELSEMVGTTRPRISEFMCKFQALGLIETTVERHLVVKANRLHTYLLHSVRDPSSAKSHHPG